MVKVQGSDHIRAMRAYAQRKLALQKRELAREEEELNQQLQAQAKQQLPTYDADDHGRFAGYDAIFKCEGDNYEALHRVLKKVMRPAHYRTWAAANSEKGNGPPPCTTAREIAEQVGRHRRTIEIDLQEMRKNKFLQMHPAQRDGRWVMEMHYDVLYRLVHEYIQWERSADYIPPERTYFEYLTLAPDLERHLLQFEDYRKVLGKKKPGPKAKKISDCHEDLICPRPYVGGRPQHIHSASPAASTAFQGATERSIYSEPPTSPALPQAGRSGSAHPNTTANQHISHERPSGAIKQPVSQERPNGATEQSISREHPSHVTKQPVLQERQSNAIKQPVSQEHPGNITNQSISQERPSSAIRQPVSQECPSSVIEQPVSQARSRSRVSQEGPIMTFNAEEFMWKDSAGNSYIYPTTSLPMFFVDSPAKESKCAGGLKLPHYVDEEDILHIDDCYVPFLRDLLRCTRATYDTSHFHHRAAFEPELQRLFDPQAVGAWAAYSPKTKEVLLMMEYNPERDNVDEYMHYLAGDMENVLRYQDENLKSDMVTFDGEEISLFDIQEDAVKRYVMPDEIFDLSVEGVWTPGLSTFIEYGHPATRYFIPHTDFPIEVQTSFPPYQIGVWVTIRPDEREAYVHPCYELFMEGLCAQPAHFAIVEARVRYVTQPQSAEAASISAIENSLSTSLPEQFTDEMPTYPTNADEIQDVPYDYTFEAPEATDNYAPETTEVVENYEAKTPAIHYDYSKEQAGTSDSLMASGEVFMEATEKLPRITMPANNMDRQKLHSDRSVQENEPPVSAGSPSHRQTHSNEPLISVGPPSPKQTYSNEPPVSAGPPNPVQSHNPATPGTLSKMNLGHRSLSRRIVGNRHGKREQEQKSSPVFIQVQEVVHYDGVQESYPSVVPLLQDFMRTKLLGNDTVRRYFIPFEVMKSPGIENAFPPGSDGVWLWKQPDAPIVHVKPSCLSVDPWLKNRSATSIAVGKVADDDGYLYLGKATERPISCTPQPEEHRYENTAPKVPPTAQPEVRSTGPISRTQQPRVDDYGHAVSQAPSPPTPSGQQEVRNTSASRTQPSRVNGDRNVVSETSPAEQPKAERRSGPKTTEGPRVDSYGNTLPEVPPAEQYGRESTATPEAYQPRLDKHGNIALEMPSSEHHGRGGTSTPRAQQPRMDEYGNIVSGAPPHGRQPLILDEYGNIVSGTLFSGRQQPMLDEYGNIVSGTPPSGRQQPRLDEYGNIVSGAPPRGGRQQPRLDEYGNIVSGTPPSGRQRVTGAATSSNERLDVNYGKPSSASPPLSVQQKRQRYEAVIKRAQDGHGKGLQHLF